MNRFARLLALLFAVALVAAACDSDDDATTNDTADDVTEEQTSGPEDTTAPAEGGERVDPGSGLPLVAIGGDPSGEVGDHLTDENGFSLYLFTNDDEGVSNCSGGCASTWPPLVADGDDVAVGQGIDESLVGTIERADGSLQVTFAGQPLYYFAGDSVAGETNGQGSGGVWFLVAPDGSAIGA